MSLSVAHIRAALDQPAKAANWSETSVRAELTFSDAAPPRCYHLPFDPPRALSPWVTMDPLFKLLIIALPVALLVAIIVS